MVVGLGLGGGVACALCAGVGSASWAFVLRLEWAGNLVHLTRFEIYVIVNLRLDEEDQAQSDMQ